MIGGSLSGITFSGLGSGIDTDAIISRLMAIEALPIQRLRVQQQAIQGRQTLLQQLRATLTGLSTAAGALNSEAAFRAVSASVSNSEVASISAGSNAASGTYNLEVSRLAQTHKIASSAQADASSALGLSGFVILNGKGLAIEAGDSLTRIAQKINGLNAGVSASIIDGGANNAYVSLTSASSGANGEIQIADLTGAVAQTLGIANGAESVRDPISGAQSGARSIGFSSSATAIGTLLGATGLAPSSISINGVSIAIDLQNDSLTHIATAINALDTGATAAVVSSEENGATVYHLQITGATAPTFSDPDGTLKALGILQKDFGNQLVAAQDAEYSIDGIALTSASNTITGVIPDVTITLLRANEATPEKATLTLTQDNTSVKSKVKAFMDAFNEVVDFVRSNSTFDSQTFATGPLFGDSIARQTIDRLSDMVLGSVPGLTGSITNLADVGFGFDQNGKLTLDEARLDAALAADPNAVGQVFRARGESTVSTIQFISSTSRTVPSGAGLYDVFISQIATQAYSTAEVAQTEVTAASENLTFSGSLFGTQSVVVTIPAGSSQADIVDLINNDARLKNLVTASVQTGLLKVMSKKYGKSGNFDLVSNLAAASNNSGVGLNKAGPKALGLDVAGTINGEPATGNGQFLTGDGGNATTEGLQILYTGLTTGIVGSVRMTKGIGAQAGDLVSSFTDAVSGLFTVNDGELQKQIDAIGQRIEGIQARLTLREESLRRRFAAMEEAISRLQAQQARLSQFVSQQG